MTATATEIAVRRAARDDIPELAGVLTRAFAHDPYFEWMIGDARDRTIRMREDWRAILRLASAQLSETWTTNDRAGAAIWVPPGRKASTMLEALRFGPAFARLIGWSRVGAVSSGVAVLERRRDQHVPVPHYYLSALGVDPSRQGSGIGSALLAPVLAKADATGVPAYLETATARNVLLYERHGFDVVEELVLPGTDVHGWLMLRRPR